jgi:phospholipid transport system substrate-binding protein
VLTHSFIRRFVLILALFAALGAGQGQAAPTKTAPTAVIEAFHGALLSVMKQAGNLGVGGRYDQLSGPITHSYDLAIMTRISSGSFWRRATDTEKVDLIAAFSRISIGTYAARFDGYSGQSFVVEGEKAGPRGTTLVETRILSPGDTPVDITYVMKAADSGWRIVDVLLAGGISELAVRRSEYRSILKAQGVRGLITALNKMADNLVGRRG